MQDAFEPEYSIFDKIEYSFINHQYTKQPEVFLTAIGASNLSDLDLWQNLLINYCLNKSTAKPLNEKITISIFEKGIALAENNQLFYWNGAAMALNYFCESKNAFDKKRTQILLDKIIANFWGFYENEPLIFEMRQGFIGLLIVLCKCLEKNPSSHLRELIEKVINEISLAKQTVSLNGEFLNLFPNYYDRKNSEVFFENKLSWNYGNLAVALLFFHLGNIIHPNYHRWLDRILSLSLAQKIDKLDEKGFTISSGTAGCAIMYDYFGARLSENRYFGAAQYWIEQTRQLIQTNQDSATPPSIVLDSAIGAGFAIESLKTRQKDWLRLLLL